MIRLNTTNKTLRIYSDATAATTEPTFVTAYDDINSITPVMTPGGNDGALTGVTPVTVVGAPSAAIYRNIKYVNVHNEDTASRIIIVELRNSSISTTLIRVTLKTREQLVFNDGAGWMVITTLGEKKVTGVSGYSGAAADPNFGLLNISAARNSQSASNIYLNVEDNVPMSKAPFVMPFNGTIIAMTATCNTATGNWSIEVRNAGVLVSGAVLNLTSIQTNNYATYSVDVNAGDLLQLYMSGTGIDSPRGTVIIKRR